MKNHTMIQFFEWYLPDNGLLWKRCTKQAQDLKDNGIDMVWLPPAYKGTYSGDTGYGVYDMYDLGEFDQKGTIRTKYGTKDEYIEAVKAMQEAGMQVLADVVLNHRMGADGCEEIEVEEDSEADRNQEICGIKKIQAWTKFEFPGRHGKYSDFCWNHKHFSGTDWDEASKKKGIYRLFGKNWNRETDNEKGNYDYLMGADLDVENLEVIEETRRWAKWYLDTVGMDGFRLDAVKHISFSFYQEWIKAVREVTGRDLFVVGEYWSQRRDHLQHYLDVTEHLMSLFDVPLHFNFYQASNGGGGYDMRQLFVGTLVETNSDCAVTFVDNHDTQPGQALGSFVASWFKPLAYAAILLREGGIPCVFYGDYYGIPHNGIAPVSKLRTLCKLREKYAYGKQNDYFDNESVIGWTREGDDEHKDSGLAVLMTDSVEGCKQMYIGTKFAGEQFYDVTGNCTAPVQIQSDGTGMFGVSGGSVSVWVREQARDFLWMWQD